MAKITQLFGVNAEGLFDVHPDHSWPQRAPVIGDKLAFNQRDAKDLDKISGTMLVSRSIDYEGIQLTYHLHAPVRGFQIGRIATSTQPFNTLVFQDATEETKLEIAYDDIVQSHNLTESDVHTVGILYAAAALDRMITEQARRQVAMDEELGQMLS